MIPGGAGVREAALTELLATDYSAATALLAAVALRVIWLVSEVVVSAILYVVVRESAPAD